MGNRSTEGLIRAFLILGVSLTTMVVLVAGVVRADPKPVGTNTFSTDTIELSSSPAAIVSMGNMVPGDEATQEIVVSNRSATRVKYTVTSTATNTDGLALMRQLDLTVRQGTCPASGGQVLYGPGDLGSAEGLELFSGRILDQSGVEHLCLHVKFPLDTGNRYQGAATTATLSFLVEQVPAGP